MFESNEFELLPISVFFGITYQTVRDMGDGTSRKTTTPKTTYGSTLVPSHLCDRTGEKRSSILHVHIRISEDIATRECNLAVGSSFRRLFDRSLNCRTTKNDFQRICDLYFQWALFNDLTHWFSDLRWLG